MRRPGYEKVPVLLGLSSENGFSAKVCKMVTDQDIEREFEEFSVSIDDLTVLDKCRLLIVSNNEAVSVDAIAWLLYIKLLLGL